MPMRLLTVLILSLCLHVGSLVWAGGSSSGGGGGSIFFRSETDSNPILLDFAAFDPDFWEKHYEGQVPGDPLPTHLAQGDRIRLEDIPAYRLVMDRLSLWDYWSPFVVSLLRQSIQLMDFRYTQMPLPVSSHYHVPDSLKQRYRSRPIHQGWSFQTAISYHTHGTWVNGGLWGQLQLSSQAGLLLHEAFRSIQNIYFSGISEKELQNIVATVMLTDPPQVRESEEVYEDVVGRRTFIELLLKVGQFEGKLKEDIQKYHHLENGEQTVPPRFRIKTRKVIRDFCDSDLRKTFSKSPYGKISLRVERLCNKPIRFSSKLVFTGPGRMSVSRTHLPELDALHKELIQAVNEGNVDKAFLNRISSFQSEMSVAPNQEIAIRKYFAEEWYRSLRNQMSFLVDGMEYLTIYKKFTYNQGCMFPLLALNEVYHNALADSVDKHQGTISDMFTLGEKVIWMVNHPAPLRWSRLLEKYLPDMKAFCSQGLDIFDSSQEAVDFALHFARFFREFELMMTHLRMTGPLSVMAPPVSLLLPSIK